MQNESLKSFKKSFEESNKKNKILVNELSCLKEKLLNSTSKDFKISLTTEFDGIKTTPCKDDYTLKDKIYYTENIEKFQSQRTNESDNSFLMRKRKIGNGIIIEEDKKENNKTCKRPKTEHIIENLNCKENDANFMKIKEFNL